VDTVWIFFCETEYTVFLPKKYFGRVSLKIPTKKTLTNGSKKRLKWPIILNISILCNLMIILKVSPSLTPLFEGFFLGFTKVVQSGARERAKPCCWMGPGPNWGKQWERPGAGPCNGRAAVH